MSKRATYKYNHKSEHQQCTRKLRITIGKALGIISCEADWDDSSETTDYVSIEISHDELRKMVDAIDARLKELGK